MYRLKEAIIIFWGILTHKYYFFASKKKMEIGAPGRCYLSAEAENDTIFLDCVSLTADKIKLRNFKHLDNEQRKQ